jgi:hypothetical protein
VAGASSNQMITKIDGILLSADDLPLGTYAKMFDQARRSALDGIQLQLSDFRNKLQLGVWEVVNV